jgi:hypothetical protein
MARKSAKKSPGGGPGVSTMGQVKTTQTPVFGQRVAGKRSSGKSGRSGRR